ncbi:MAG: DUF3667 domain-containing protein [Acidobacteria bacterium]|nr:DUF3667 domain-containing protein [Acidobacteriota bacterium]
MAEAAQTAEARPAPEGPDECPSCGAALAGDYCHRCGEKRPEARDLSIRHFVMDAAKELTSLDTKLTRTLLALLFRPGRLTAEWVAGRRGPYLKPLNLCLGILALNLFVYTASKQATMFDIRLILENQRQLAAQWKMPNGDLYDRLFSRAAARKGTTAEALYDTVNEHWQRNVSLLQPLQIVTLAVLLQLIYFFSRRYFVEHLVFAMHYLSFAVLTTTLMWPLYYLLGIHPTLKNMALAFGKYALDIIYLFVALRVFYRGRLALAVLRALITFVGYFVGYAVVYMLAIAAALFTVLR